MRFTRENVAVVFGRWGYSGSHPATISMLDCAVETRVHVLIDR